MSEDYSVPNPKQLEVGGRVIVEATNESNGGLLDRTWTKTAFMVSDSEINETRDVVNRYWSSASAKFVDTRVGCNIGINQRPAWTRYCDLPVKGNWPDRKELSISQIDPNLGMGRAYSESIDDPAQKIFLRFGVPRFNSLVDFLLRAFDREMSIVARTGRAPSAWYKLGKIGGTAIAFVAAPFLTLTIEAAKAAAWLFGRETSKFFTLKPAMHYYWCTVNSLCLNHAVNTGIVKKVLADTESQRLGRPYTLDEDQINAISKIAPDMINSDGVFDIWAIANKAQRQANRMFELDYKRLDEQSSTDWEGYLSRDSSGNGRHSSWLSNDKGSPSLASFIQRYVTLSDYYKHPDENPDTGTSHVKTELDPRIDLKSKDGKQALLGEHIDDVLKYLDAEYNDGSQFACFRVDYTGTVQESFGNTTGESALQQKLNGISSDIKEARFSLADGNIIGGKIGAVVGGVKDVISGAIDGVTLGFSGLIAGLGGSGYIDIPKHWQSSSASLPRGSYTLQLISPYNNPISRMINIWIPFYMLLAGVLPRSTGKQSYTSPYYCQLFDRGRVQSRLAMIESLSINRGTSNLGWDTRGQALALDLSFTVVDLSSIMHMPMSSGGITETDMTMDDDNITADYLNVLAGMDIYSQIYPIPKAQLKATKVLAGMKQKATSAAFHASLFKNSLEDGLINDLTFGASGKVSSLFGGLKHGTAALEGNRN